MFSKLLLALSQLRLYWHPPLKRPFNVALLISPKRNYSLLKDNSKSTKPSRRPLTHPGPLNVYFHVVAANETVEGGWIPDRAIDAQMTVLNEDFASTGVQWVLAGVDRTVNASLFNYVASFNEYEGEMKYKLRRGNMSDLNIYTVGFASPLSKGLLGYSTFPSSYASDPTNDGIVVLHSSFLVGGCSGVGDLVDDTPAESNPASGCPVGRDTCPSPGVDPIINFMDYSYDSCMYEFTPGQADRMKDQLRTYRDVQI
ncbi:hypothetical protein BDQ17DRAFT_1421285 [Cyathus striatus]|nr:hypothetical protein BDQ17DRAFT_1421285 [Cyathus striatus]